MKYKIKTFGTNHQFEASAEQNIIDAALDAGIMLPYSCKSGSCSACRGRVVEGEFEQSSFVKGMLTQEEIAEGYTLFCQVKPKSDMVIEPREVRLVTDIQVRKMPARVMGLNQMASDVMLVKLQLPSSDPFLFYAGQYIEIILKDASRRAYSIASSPTAATGCLVDLHIRHLPGGKFTDHVFGAGATKMKEREILRVEGPLGSFFLREESDAPIIMLATGTGFAPIKSMIEHSLEQNLRRPIHLYWGGRKREDLYAYELALGWEQQYEHIKFIPVLSRPTEQDDWHGRVGHVQQQVMQDFESLAGFQVYACGSPLMIETAQKLLSEERQLDPNEFYADAFVVSN